MGYKGFVRSATAAANRIQKEQQRQQRQNEKLSAKIQKKQDNIDAKIAGIYAQLDSVYAEGKIDEAKYTELVQRKSDISIIFVAIGKAPYIALAKRYITGKIDKVEFEKISSTIIPSDLQTEIENIENNFDENEKEFLAFVNEIENTVTNCCQKCSKKKTLFSGLVSILELKLCVKCSNEFRAKLAYNGHSGKYLDVSPIMQKSLNWEAPSVNLRLEVL